jgi:enoyl-CoA hydratase/carnithine racemase
VAAVAINVDDRGIATLTIDNPPINLLSVDVFIEIAKASAELAGSAEVRAVVLRSAHPEWFIAHFDVEAILQMPTDQPAPTTLNNFHRMCETFRTMPKPTIAIIEGRVGGGGNELAMSCDMRFATPNAIFNQPEVALGIIPGGSGTVRLPRLVGRGRALEVILGCDDIDAATAERWGMINRVLPTEAIEAFVDRLTARIASFPPAAVAAAKASVLRSEQSIEGELLAEGTAFSALLGDDDTVAALAAFMDRGGQTPEGERRLGELAAELGRPPESRS